MSTHHDVDDDFLLSPWVLLFWPVVAVLFIWAAIGHWLLLQITYLWDAIDGVNGTESKRALARKDGVK